MTNPLSHVQRLTRADVCGGLATFVLMKKVSKVLLHSSRKTNRNLPLPLPIETGIPDGTDSPRTLQLTFDILDRYQILVFTASLTGYGKAILLYSQSPCFHVHTEHLELYDT